MPVLYKPELWLPWAASTLVWADHPAPFMWGDHASLLAWAASLFIWADGPTLFFIFYFILPQWAFVLELWWHRERTKVHFSFLTLCYDENGTLVSSSQLVTLTVGPRKTGV